MAVELGIPQSPHVVSCDVSCAGLAKPAARLNCRAYTKTLDTIVVRSAGGTGIEVSVRPAMPLSLALRLWPTRPWRAPAISHAYSWLPVAGSCVIAGLCLCESSFAQLGCMVVTTPRDLDNDAPL